jgi:hypothetical protein
VVYRKELGGRMNSLLKCWFTTFDILLTLEKDREGSRVITSPIQLELYGVRCTGGMIPKMGVEMS